ncbi:MAG: hypothetical protein N5P05_002172 [Chroococcopsis gigantea SAG 12.99]|jgi:Ca2+-binding RTX toxin-like protein|nr:calcium-binding protein [Chlorogloea purpurea SAG 13.99]MDV3000566.1 hypothetical protein [Chroococcopsis gigantea SAG 12.99]
MPTYTGTNGNDNLPTSGSNNSGNDIFIPLLGIDTVDGGSGDDLLIIDYSSNTYTGNATYAAGISTNISESVPGTFTGNYLAYKNTTGTYDQVNFSNIERFQITGTNFNDTIVTGWNNDVINAGGGNDIIDGRGGIDTIDGGAGTDTVIYLDASDETANLVINNSGARIGLTNGTVITNVEQFQNVDAGGGNDTIAFSDSLNHAIDGGGGNDAITTGGANDTITGGDGNDTINAGLGINNVYGGTGNDLLVLDYSSNTYAGNVTYPAGITLSYYSGNGFTGWSGNYFAYNNGSGGYDQVYFQDIERFQVTGTAYNDSFDQAGYGSIIDGGAGIDTLNNVDFSLETGNMSLDNSGATYTRSDGSTIRNVEKFGNVTLGSGNDTIAFTDNLNHTLTGGDGSDSLTAGGGNDTLNGGDGDDTLNAGFGNNQALGGAGNDLLILDYSGNTYAGTVNYPAGIVVNSYGGDSTNGWTGYYSAYKNSTGASDQVYYQDIERFQITGTAYSDAFGQVSAASSIDGGLGTDTITNADFNNETGNLTINNSGAAITLSDGSVIRNVERFVNLTTGSGNDTISFTDNLGHQIDAGAGNNSVTTGSGDDTIITDLGNDTINAGLGNNNVDGGAGNDLLIIDYSGNTLGTNSGYPAGISSSISNNGASGWSGYYYAYNTATFDQVYFNNIELLQVIGTSYNDTFDQWGYGFTINGGAGTDTIVFANFVRETANLTINNSGGAIALSDGSTISNVEQFQNLTTGSGNDTISFNDTLSHYILGGAGNDVITTGAGNDGINGGAGNDTLNAGLGYNNADGGSGNDLLILDYSSNTFPGNGSFPGGITSSLSGNSLTGWSGSFLAYNNANGTYDLVSFSSIERFQLVGTGANDSFQRGGYGFTINGGAGTDTIVNANFSRETGNLTLNNSGATITLIDGSTIANVEQFQNLTTGSGGDTIAFTDNLNRTLNTGLGNDVITTGAGNDTINGGAGNDTINPGRGINSVDAGTGNDLLIFDYSGNTYTGNTTYPAGITSSIGGNSIAGWNGYFSANTSASGTSDQVSFSGIDRFQITGTSYGDSFFQGGYGFNIDGGAGTDTIVFADFSRETGNLTLNNTGTPITLSDGTVIRNVEQFQNLTTGTGNDTVNLTDNLNKGINTGTGNDAITTGAGNDNINSGIGNDTLNAGLGNNSVDGGKGNDLLILDYSSNTYAGNATYTAGITSSLSYPGLGAWNGSFSAFKNTSGGSDSVSFNNIEQFQITGTGFNDSIGGGSNSDTIRGGAGRDTLNGGGGIDTLSYAGSTAGVNVNLTTNTATGGDATGDVISGFENLIGSANNDTLVGNADSNVIIGGGGADSLDGGAGIDTLSFATATAAVNVNLATGAVTGGNTTTGSSFTNFENLIGSGLNDTLIGSAGDNVIGGGAGADSIDGGAGVDTLSYETSTGGVSVNLATNAATGGEATGDVIANFENVNGSAGNDTLTGSAVSNALSGGGGNDLINGGAGADSQDGGAGIDTLSYAGSTAGVNVNLATNTATGGAATGDVIANFENLTGSGLNDTLIGSMANNTISGGVGKDSLTGGGGSDRFVYNALADSLLANFDVITDFNGADDFFLVGTSRTSFNNVGAVTTLNAAGIGAKLTSTAFASNSAAQFTFGSRNFVAINNATAGFSATTDAIVELTGLTGSLGIGNFVTL